MTTSPYTSTPTSLATSVTDAQPVPRAAAALTGLVCTVLGAISLTGPVVPDEHWGARGSLVNALGLVAFAAMGVALELLPNLLGLGRLGRTGRRVTQAGLVLMVTESAASQIHGGTTLGFVFMLGLLLTMVGLVLVATDGLRRQHWLAPLPLLAMLLGIGAGDHGGFIVLGLTWAGLAVLKPATARGTAAS